MLKAEACDTNQKWVMLYVERWLNASMLMPDGAILDRVEETPQCPISLLIANVFL